MRSRYIFSVTVGDDSGLSVRFVACLVPCEKSIIFSVTVGDDSGLSVRLVACLVPCEKSIHLQCYRRR